MTDKHGTIYAYRQGCRCEECRQANWEKTRKWRQKAAAGETPERAHGTINGYKVYGCRCELCRGAKLTNDRQQREKRRRVARLALAGLPADWEGDDLVIGH
jgi:cytochrome c5